MASSRESTSPEELGGSDSAVDESREDEAISPVVAPEQEREPEEPLLRSILGSVLDNTGVPLPGVEVTASALTAEPPDSGAGNAQQTVTDSLGLYEFDELTEGEYLLVVHESDSFHPGSLRARAGSGTADIHLQRKGSIQVIGTVLHEESGLAGAAVRLLGGSRRIFTDPVGQFEIEIDLGRIDAQPVLEISKAGFRTIRERIQAKPSAPGEPAIVAVDMEPLNELVDFLGTVANERGEPVADATVSLSAMETGSYKRVGTGPQGTFAFTDVEAGIRYRVVVDADGSYRRFTSDPIVIDAGNNALDIILRDGGPASIEGTVVSPSGQILPGFTLWLRNPESAAGGMVPIRTDARGKFTAVEIEAGSLSFQSRSSPRLEVLDIALMPGEHRHVRIPIDWGDQWLLGQVVDDEGRPIAEASVTIHWTRDFADGRSLSSRQTRSDMGGFFSFSNLGASEYILSSSAPGYAALRMQASPQAGRELVIRLERPTSGGS